MQHDLVAFFPGVEPVQHIGGAGFKPADAGLGCIAPGHHGKTGGLLLKVAQLVFALRQQFFVPVQGEVVEDGKVFGEHHVVGQTRARQGHRHIVHQLVVSVDLAVMHVGRLFAVVEKQ